MGLTRPCCLSSSSTFSSLISSSLFSFPNSSISSTTPFCVWQVLVYLWNAELSLISEYLRWKNYERSLQNYDLPVWKRFRKISLFLPRKTSLWIKPSLQDTFPVLQDDYPVHHLQEAGVVGRHDPGGSWVEDANVVKNLVALERSPFGPIRWWKRWLATYSHNSISIEISVLRQSSWDLSVNSTQRTIKQNKLKKVKIAKGEFFIVAKINLWFWESSSGKCHSLFLTSRKVHLERRGGQCLQICRNDMDDIWSSIPWYDMFDMAMLTPCSPIWVLSPAGRRARSGERAEHSKTWTLIVWK